MELTATPRGNRLHIGIFGRRNSGKSSLINAFTGQQLAVVSDFAGTTTDPIYKSMEIHPLGPCVLIDTAGFDDEGALGALRVEKTRQAMDKTDIALLLFSSMDFSREKIWLEEFRARKIPVVAVVSRIDEREDTDALALAIREELRLEPVLVSAAQRLGMEQLREALVRAIPADFEAPSLTGHLVQPGDLVLLVMPQDIQAPKGRLILPQVQTLRDLLDHKCIVMSVTTDRLDDALARLTEPPKLIITDSQVFRTVYAKKPPKSLLTSFSVLLAGSKGRIEDFVEGAAAVDALTERSRVLIAEACTHVPLNEDIGRVKIPRLLRERVGNKLTIDFVNGADFPADLSPYDLIIQCGSCMFNRKFVLTRIARAKAAHVPITNYGVVLAKLGGILDDIQY